MTGFEKEGGMKVAIVGSRGFPKLEMVKKVVDRLKPEDVLVSGGAPGVDQAAEKAAEARGLMVHSIRPNWDKQGKGAGMIRNGAIVREADKLIAFWNGKSNGTWDTIQKALDKGIDIDICVRRKHEE